MLRLPRELETVALALCDGCAGEWGPRVKSLILAHQWDELANLSVDPGDFTTAEEYFRAAVCVSFLRKYEALPTSIDKEEVAKRNFFEAERNCYRTNQRLLPFIHNTYGVEDEAKYEFILDVRKEVVALIGSAPSGNPEGRFGPGATYGDKACLATIPDKMQSRPSLTRSAWAFLVPWSGTLWARACAERGDDIDYAPGNRFATAPKDATKYRGICLEASINMFYQLAYGRDMRKALSLNTAGRLHLETAQIRHRRVACAASITGESATIDVTQASDHQARAFVQLLLPRRWYEPLDDLRSTHTVINDDGRDKKVLLEKFSSMGNGYTFELETTLFLAICCAVMRRMSIEPHPGDNVHVFGDDIIVPTVCAANVISALRFFGFEINKRKTFVDGPFRESCGGDYFNGVDVRPYFQKKEVYEPQHYIAMANGIRRMAASSSRADSRWPIVERAWFRTLDSIPSDIRHCRGPEELGDICINDRTEFWTTRTRSSIRYVKVYRPAQHRKVRWQVFDPNVRLAGLTYSPGSYGSYPSIFSPVPLGVTPRDSVLGYKIGWVPYS